MGGKVGTYGLENTWTRVAHRVREICGKKRGPNNQSKSRAETETQANNYKALFLRQVPESQQHLAE